MHTKNRTSTLPISTLWAANKTGAGLVGATAQLVEETRLSLAKGISPERSEAAQSRGRRQPSLALCGGLETAKREAFWKSDPREGEA